MRGKRLYLLLCASGVLSTLHVPLAVGAAAGAAEGAEGVASVADAGGHAHGSVRENPDGEQDPVDVLVDAGAGPAHRDPAPYTAAPPLMPGPP